MVECTALEMRRAFAGTVGSNPTLSAIRRTDQGQTAQVRDVGSVKIDRHPRPTFGDEFE